MDDDALAAHMAEEAGALLRDVQGSAPASELGSRALKDRGDRESQAYLAATLRELRPADSVLSEEAADTTARRAAERVWIIDPLDGTREFSEGREDWAVHVALWERGELRVGAVALPADGIVLSTTDPPQQWARPRALRLAISRTRASPLVNSLAMALGAELVPIGSAGYKTGAVVRGRVDAYVHTGGQYEWDSAAPVAVARAAGLFTSRINGDPLRYNNIDPFLPDLVISNPHIAARLMAEISAITSKEPP